MQDPVSIELGCPNGTKFVWTYLRNLSRVTVLLFAATYSSYRFLTVCFGPSYALVKYSHTAIPPPQFVNSRVFCSPADWQSAILGARGVFAIG
jgi:hypothetical protein